jgi:hypothetical protein
MLAALRLGFGPVPFQVRKVFNPANASRLSSLTQPLGAFAIGLDF